MKILQERFAMWLLIRIYQNDGMFKRDAVAESEGSHMAKYETLQKLIDAGLVIIDDAPRKNKKIFLHLSDDGKEIARRLSEIHDILPYVEIDPKDYR